MKDLTRLITPPQVEPVTLEEAKEYLRVDGFDLDARIQALIPRAREACERFTRRAFIEQTWEVDCEIFSEDDLPYPPLMEIVSNDGTTIRFKAGYGSTPEDVPPALKEAVLARIWEMLTQQPFDERNSLSASLLRDFRVMRL